MTAIVKICILTRSNCFTILYWYNFVWIITSESLCKPWCSFTMNMMDSRVLDGSGLAHLDSLLIGNYTRSHLAWIWLKYSLWKNISIIPVSIRLNCFMHLFHSWFNTDALNAPFQQHIAFSCTNGVFTTGTVYIHVNVVEHQ